MPYNDKRQEEELIKVKACYLVCLYPRPENLLGTEGNEWGITKWEVEEVIQGKVKYDKKSTIVVKGTFPEPLSKKEPYTIVGRYQEDPKYGDYYELVYINQEVNLLKPSNQKLFLQKILTEKQVENLYATYENPFVHIESKNIDKLTEVKGIGASHALKIIEKYEQNKDYSQLYIELDEYNLTPLMMKKLLEKYKSPQAVIDAVKHHPYTLVEVDGIGFKKADEYALRGGIPPKSIERVKAYIIYELKENQANKAGNSYITLSELSTIMYDAFGCKENIYEDLYDEEGNRIGSNISAALSQLEKEGTIKVEKDESEKATGRSRIYLTYYWNLENKIAYHLTRLLNGEPSGKFDNSGWEKRILKLEDKQGFSFAKEQLDGIKLGMDKQVCLICGLAGAGKSSLVSGILEGLNAVPYPTTYDEPPGFAQCALSGKAAARLQEVTGAAGSTIHRLLKYSPISNRFEYNAYNNLPYDIVILDEISLVGGEIFLDLIQAIPTGSKLIMLGDLGQLAAVGTLNIASDLYHSDIIPTVELKEIHRQAAKSGIITSAHNVRNQIQLFDYNFEGVDIKGELQDMIFDITLEDYRDHRDKVLEWFKKFYDSDIVKKDIMKIQVISPLRERGDTSVFNLNNDIQEYVNPLKPNEKGLTIKNKNKGESFTIHKNDKVMCVKNNYKLFDVNGSLSPIYNGWVGIVTAIREQDKEMDVYFPLGQATVTIPYSTAKTDLVLGYVSTIHKLQGSDAPVVIGVLNYSVPYIMLENSLLYTLITRAKKKCVLIGENNAVRTTISNNYIVQKQTFLQELLITNNKRY